MMISENEPQTNLDRAFFGAGFSDEEFAELERVYNEWTGDKGEPSDVAQRELYKNICFQNLQLRRALQNGDNTCQIVNSLQSLCSSPLLRAADESRTLGELIRDVETSMPAEFFENKPLYDDYDGFGEYFDKYIAQPLKNLVDSGKNESAV